MSLLPFTIAEVNTVSLSWVSPPTISLVRAAGIFPGLLSYFAYSFMVGQLGANLGGLVLYFGPVYAAFVA